MTIQTTEDVLFEFYSKKNEELTRGFFGEQEILIPHGTTGNQGIYDWRHSEFTLEGTTSAYIANIPNLNGSYFMVDSSCNGYKTTPYANGIVIDAEKAFLYEKDKNMCWAATDSNLMIQTGWIPSFIENEDQIFNLYRKSFLYGASRYGSPYDGADWYLTGPYNPNIGSQTIQVDECIAGTGGYFANHVYIYNLSYYLSYDEAVLNSYSFLESAFSNLKNGKAVGLRIAQYKWGVPERSYHHASGIYIRAENGREYRI